jgi:iron complex outermembrane recepter protein
MKQQTDAKAADQKARSPVVTHLFGWRMRAHEHNIFLLLSILISGLLKPGEAIAADVAPVTQDAVLDTVIVTGTRTTGKAARESATPIDVISSHDLQATGQTNLLDALKSILPSISAQAVGYDFGALARTFQMRGLSPSHTLVLVNGKLRHLSASLYADSDSGAQGSNVVDLDFIPLSAVDHVEVLRDGAAAQYGSGAIAGVINVILKSSPSGGSVSVLGGGYFDGGGPTRQVDLDSGFAFGSGGSLHLSAGYRFHGFSNRSGESGGPEPAKVQGDPRSGVGSLGFNMQVGPETGVSGYMFGTVGQRSAYAYENPRQPGATGVPAVDTLYPNGFTPRENIRETDFSLTAGIKGKAVGGWDWDLSATTGRDNVQLGIDRTVNPVLYGDTGNAQQSFHAGSFASSEYTFNLDAKRDVSAFNFAKPITVAFGVQDRYEKFAIGAGELNSYVFGGSAGFQGFRIEDQIHAARNSVAAYVELDTRVTQAWELGAATRAEHYDRVGGKLAGKLTSRYDVSPGFAVRGSMSNGLHAPSLAQQYYSNTGVAQTQAYVQLAPGSPGGRLLGAPDLKPEVSRNVTIGIVLAPTAETHLTIDAYQIDIKDRIINTAQLNNSQLGVDAVQANGVVIPAGVNASNTYVSFFTNGVDTRTRGIDAVFDARSALDMGGVIKWVLSAGYNRSSIQHVHQAPGVLAAAGLSLVGPEQRTDLTTAAPHLKASLAGTLLRGNWDATLRETYYGKTSQVQGYDPYYAYETSAAWITNVDVGYKLTKNMKLTIGANNLFNKYPAKVSAAVYQNITFNYDQYSHATPYGTNGGYYYLRLEAFF